MSHDKTTEPTLTMHWVPEVDASGRTRLVTRWDVDVPAVTAAVTAASAVSAPIEVGHAA